jgi:peptidoglycan/xylan/chitin deacetylase (PgdA/CDA1 family)
VSILAYHMVDTRFDWGITRVTPKQFVKQIDYAQSAGYKFLTAGDYAATNDKTKTLCLTFDDGYESVFDYAFPVLKKYNIPATIFINPDFVGQRNTWDVNIGWLKFNHLSWIQILELNSNGWEIGSHGLTHRDLTRLDGFQLMEELKSSKTLIENKIKKRVNSISYPFGNANPDVCKKANKCGYLFGFSMSQSLQGEYENMSIPRTGVYLIDNFTSFKEKASGKSKRFYRLLQRTLDICSNGSVLMKEGLGSQK